MFHKMYDTMDAICRKAAVAAKVPIKIPRPGKRALKISAFTNGLVGIGFILFGALSPHKWSIILGGLGLAGSLLVSCKARSLQ